MEKLTRNLDKSRKIYRKKARKIYKKWKNLRHRGKTYRKNRQIQKNLQKKVLKNSKSGKTYDTVEKLTEKIDKPRKIYRKTT